MKKLSLRKSDIAAIIIFWVMVAINIIARLSAAFSDYYVEKVFPVISTPFIWLSGLLPFSLGELMMAIAALLLIIGVPALIAFCIVKRKDKPGKSKVISVSGRLCLWAAVYIFTTETLNCFVMYQCSTFSEKYFPETSHTEELLLDTLSEVSSHLSELSGSFTRGEDGYIVLDKDYDNECIFALKAISGEYSQLKGYYPRPKKIVSSFFMSQQGIIGLYIPFAFEATYNRDPQDISKPSTICHELCHLKGIIQENEASFAAILACTKSQSEVLRYSGYLDAFYYLYTNAYDLMGTEYEEALRQAVACVPAEVWDYDMYSFKKNYWEENKDKEIIPTETVQAVSDALTEANLQFNDVKEGKLIYYRVTELLMDYYALYGSI